MTNQANSPRTFENFKAVRLVVAERVQWQTGEHRNSGVIH